MSTKSDRQNAILQIIGEERIACQEDLLGHLTRKGWDVTQATLSRDLKELGVIKAHSHSGGYVYRPAEFPPSRMSLSDNSKITGGGIKALEFSGNLAVIRTVPGFAGAIASVLDSSSIPEIAGSVAGDDTVILVIREGFSRQQVTRSLSNYIEGIQNKLR